MNREKLRIKTERDLAKVNKEYSEIKRVNSVLVNTESILNELDEKFEKTTGLNQIDSKILFIAIGLQVIRQYCITAFPPRLDDQTAAKKTFGHSEEHSNRKHRLYMPSLEEIITNPVPFDANIGANGALAGGGKMGHRVTAIGHDPILGLLFGTANIATSTLTTANMQSYHIYTGEVGNTRRDVFRCKADTAKVIKYTADKLINGGEEGRLIVATSLCKEIIHLKSDINTINGLPLPIMSIFSTQIAADLVSYGFDMSNSLNVGKQAIYAQLINVIVAMIHRLFFTGISESDKLLYEVKTRKIITYSNVVASSSNLEVTAITKDFKRFDLGGLAVILSQLITNKRFIREVKEQFIFGSFRDMIMGDE